MITLERLSVRIEMVFFFFFWRLASSDIAWVSWESDELAGSWALQHVRTCTICNEALIDREMFPQPVRGDTM